MTENKGFINWIKGFNKYLIECLTSKTTLQRISAYYLIICTFLLTGIAILTHIYSPSIDEVTRLIIYVACSGGLGGLATCLYDYSKQMKDDNFKQENFWYFVCSPVLGVIYGIFFLFLAVGGLLTLAGASQGQISTTFGDPKTVMFYCAVAFLAGYAVDPFTLQLKAIAEGIFKEPKEQQIGSIGVTSVPSDAKIKLDGQETKKVTPCILNNVVPGSHNVEINLAGYVPASKIVIASAGVTAAADFELVKSG